MLAVAQSSLLFFLYGVVVYAGVEAGATGVDFLVRALELTSEGGIIRGVTCMRAGVLG